MSILCARRGTRLHSLCKASTQALLLPIVLYLMCVLNSIKPLSLKPGGGWLSFFPAVSRGPRWGPHSDTVHIALFAQTGPILCLSRIIKIYKSVYLLGLFLPKWIDIGPALSVCCSERAQVVLRKSWVLLGSLYLYYSLGYVLLADVAKIKQERHCSLACMGVSLCGTISKDGGKKIIMQSFKYHRFSPTIPLSIYPCTATHKAIQMYNLTKEDLESEEEKTLHYDFKINLSKESSGIRCRDQRDINTTAVPPWLLSICPSCPELWGMCCSNQRLTLKWWGSAFKTIPIITSSYYLLCWALNFFSS